MGQRATWPGRRALDVLPRNAPAWSRSRDAVQRQAQLERGAARNRRRIRALSVCVGAWSRLLRLLARRRTVAVSQCRDRFPDADRRSLRNEDRVERAVGLGFVDDRRLVGLDLDQRFAASE